MTSRSTVTPPRGRALQSVRGRARARDTDTSSTEVNRRTSPLEHAPLPIAVFRGPHHECIVSSAEWQQLFGPDVPLTLRAKLDHVHQSRELSEVEVRVRGARTYRTLIQPLPDDEVMAACIDRTDAQRARADAARSQRFKQQLLAAVSHDLRAPMSTILLWERVLRDRVEEVDVREQALDAIHESASGQASLIATLVDVSAVINGPGQLALDRVPFEPILGAAFERQLETARSNAVCLTRHYRSTLGHVDADSARLRLAFERVIETAVRNSPSGSTIVIAARRKAGALVTTIGERDLVASTRRRIPVADLGLGL